LSILLLFAELAILFLDNLNPSFAYGRIQNDTEISISRKMTPEFMRQKSQIMSDESDTKMKRRSAIERSETMDLSNMSPLRRNTSFAESRKYLETPVETTASTRRTSNGWSEHIQELTSKKPPSVSPRGSIKRTKDTDSSKTSTNTTHDMPTRKNPLTTSSSLNNMRKSQDDTSADSVSNSLNSTKIRQVQERSNKFLEQLSNTESPKRKLLVSASSSSIPKIAEAVVTESKQNHKLALEDMKKILAKEEQKRRYVKVKIVSDKKKSMKFMQINDVYIAKSSNANVNKIHKVKTKDSKEYHIRIKLNDKVSDDTVEIHPVLAKVLNVDQGVRIELFETMLVCNCIENIELIPHSDIAENNLGFQIAKDIDEKFKKYVNTSTRILPLILNQGQIFKLDDYLLTIKLFPSSTPACCIDSEILREGIIEVMKRGDPHEFSGMLVDEKEKKKVKAGNSIFEIQKQLDIVESVTKSIHPASNKYRVLNSEQNNVIISGQVHSGKSVICSEIRKLLESRDISVSEFNCAQYKGRKVDSIVRDMKTMLMGCLQSSPAVYIIYNLDLLCVQSHEEQQSAENEYLQKLSNNIRHLFEDFTHNYGDAVAILATVSKLSSLSSIVFKSFESYLFKNVYKIPNLDANDRRDLFKKLLQNTSSLKVDSSLDWEKFVRATEGYKIGDICQFADRTLYLAVKENFKNPLLTEDIMQKSLVVSNQLCLEGIKTESLNDGEDRFDESEKIPGMDNVIETLEEVLIWPTKYPKIFQNSPLRNQAGILLFGVPGSGKGFIVSQITKRWNLRLISIKGPELLAKYIGQSEENVRNLFEKAKSAKPCVLFFDEFESLAPRRGHDSTGVTDRVVNQLLTELDGVKSLEGVSVICATSRPDLIDPALLRSGRIDRLVECELPNANERLEILRWLSKSLALDSSVNLKEFATKSPNFTGADIKSILTTANMNAIEEELKLTNGRSLDKVLIKKNHLEQALSNTRPSLTQSDIDKYKNLYDRFKNKKSVTLETPKKVSLA
jgi:peroxin-1